MLLLLSKFAFKTKSSRKSTDTSDQQRKIPQCIARSIMLSEDVLIWLRDEAFFVKAKEKEEIEKQLDKNYRSKQDVQP